MHACRLGRVGGADALPRLGLRASFECVVIAKSEVAPSSAFVSAAVSSSDAATSVAPASARDLARLEFGSRVTARTLWPRSSRPRATRRLVYLWIP